VYLSSACLSLLSVSPLPLSSLLAFLLRGLLCLSLSSVCLSPLPVFILYLSLSSACLSFLCLSLSSACLLCFSLFSACFLCLSFCSACLSTLPVSALPDSLFFQSLYLVSGLFLFLYVSPVTVPFLSYLFHLPPLTFSVNPCLSRLSYTCLCRLPL
jgi:hypothetical protein